MSGLHLIVAKDKNGGIGKKNTIPWHLPSDLKHFKKITTETTDPNKVNAVIMGRKTWKSLPESFRPLPGRLNVILSRNHAFEHPKECKLFTNLGEAVTALEADPNVEKIFIIGGGTLYRQTINHCQTLYITQLDKGFRHDAIFPQIPSDFSLVEESDPQEENDISFRFQMWRKEDSTA